jgi:hypothetical protein
MTARATIWKSFSDIYQVIRADAGVFPQITPQNLLSANLFTHISLIILTFYVIW